jgi:hypothetical protein|tara:strand:- start:9 stop:176 length:168 start_codon:yes stop_codon:yes gene_type:complete
MGVLLDSTVDVRIFKEALDEADFIVSRAKKDSPSPTKQQKVAQPKKPITKPSGYW